MMLMKIMNSTANTHISLNKKDYGDIDDYGRDENDDDYNIDHDEHEEYEEYEYADRGEDKRL